MKAFRLVCLLACLSLVAAACGDDDGGAATTSAPASTQAPSTAPAETTAAPATTAPANTTTTTTTLPADTHAVFGISWADVWPADGSTAVYRTSQGDGTSEDLPAILEYGVDFRGETFDRLTIGIPGGGSDAMEVYFDRSEPWHIGIKAVATYIPEVPDGPLIVEVFDDPTVFNGSLPEGESDTKDVEVILEFAAGTEARMPATYDLVLVGINETVETPLGTVTGTALMHGSVAGEEFVGGTEPFVAELWLHPEHLIVRMTGSPAFEVLEILETWG